MNRECVADLALWKQRAAEAAVDFVRPGMVVGLGVGSTAIFALRRLAERLHSGELYDLVGIPCAEQVADSARQLGIPLTSLEERPLVDLTIDGADEVDPHLNLIKGGGGALLREKIVAQASRREIIVVDETKLSPRLCSRFALPVEVIPFGWRSHLPFLRGLGAEPHLRMGSDGAPFVTDQGNFILDCRCAPLQEPRALALQLDQRAGIVEHGLFLGLATDLIVAGAAGVRHLTR